MVEVEGAGAGLGKAAVVEGEPFVVVGVPAFNEEKTIAKVVLEAQKHADRVVVCDNGSMDLTAEIAERLGADVIRHEMPEGYGVAVGSCFRAAGVLGADVLVTLDGDGQHDPSEVPLVIEPIVENEVDIVIGSRFVDERSAHAMPWYRRAGVKLISKLVNDTSRHGVKDAGARLLGMEYYSDVYINVINPSTAYNFILWCSGALRVMYSSFGLGHAELRNALRGAYRKRRRWRWANDIHKRLLEACVGFTRNGGRIVDAAVLARLRVAFRELGIVNRRVRVIVDGEVKALEMQVQLKERNVFSWIPQLRAWLRDQAYKFWLGTMQNSLEGNACLMVGAEPS